MDVLELRNPDIVIDNAIEIIEELEEKATKEIIRLSKMSEQELNELGRENVTEVCLLSKRYTRLVNDLARVRDFASEQLLEVLGKGL